MRNLIQFIKFSLTGGLGVITDEGIYHLLRIWLNVDQSHILIYVIPMVGYLVAVVQNYLINHFWTFNEQTKNKKLSIRAFSIYLSVSLTSLIPRYLVYWLVLRSFANPYNWVPDVANLSGIVAGTSVNFLGSKFIVFKVKK